MIVTRDSISWQAYFQGKVLPARLWVLWSLIYLKGEENHFLKWIELITSFNSLGLCFDHEFLFLINFNKFCKLIALKVHWVIYLKHFWIADKNFRFLCLWILAIRFSSVYIRGINAKVEVSLVLQWQKRWGKKEKKKMVGFSTDS